jgi:lipopolysaccharide/colanic/teichoic acid biosynthesis glycosyltransferase
MPCNSLVELESALKSDLVLSLGDGLHLPNFAAGPQNPIHVDESTNTETAANQDYDFVHGRQLEVISHRIHCWRTTSFRYRVIKRALDILLILLFTPLLVPLFAVIMLLVKISSPGSIFYQQTRLGRFGKPFGVWKFRSMYKNGDVILAEYLRSNPAAAREWRECHKLRNDPRITRLGKFLRQSSLDELPQLINVLAGEMSLVGPRPIVAVEVPKYREAYLFYTSARPGMSGLWQVSGRSDLSYRQRIELDKRYVETWGLLFDFEILFRTAGAVWRSRGAV